MKNLRHRRVAGRTTLQTPAIWLHNPKTGRNGLLVLTAHLGETRYFERLQQLVEHEGVPVFYESVRARSTDEAHWREPYHRFLKTLREDLYEGISALGLLAFQTDHMKPDASWINADVDCCELADELRAREVSVGRYQMALGVLQSLVTRAKNGDEGARATLIRTLKWGLIAVSVTGVIEFVRFLPKSRRFHLVINDWRSKHAVNAVERANTDGFVLIYGAAHGDSLMAGFERAGFRELRREWHTVFAT
ncbi:MAG: hypothetical protein ABI305_13000 [Tepidiformaceae bacterium]